MWSGAAATATATVCLSVINNIAAFVAARNNVSLQHCAALHTDAAVAAEVSAKVEVTVTVTVKRQQSNVKIRQQRQQRQRQRRRQHQRAAEKAEDSAQRTQNFNIQIKVAFKSNTAAIVATP